MRINTRTRYAIRMMADIAKHGHGEPVTLKDVAEREDLSKLYLSQLTTALKSASLLKSVWGNKGGMCSPGLRRRSACSIFWKPSMARWRFSTALLTPGTAIVRSFASAGLSGQISTRRLSTF